MHACLLIHNMTRVYLFYVALHKCIYDSKRWNQIGETHFGKSLNITSETRNLRGSNNKNISQN